MSSNAASANHVPDLLYSQVEEDLRASVRSLLSDRSPWSAVLARCESDQVYDTELWRMLASGLGCAGLAVPEKHGGEGASWREVAVVAEELGRAVTPTPFLTSAVIATACVLELDDADLVERLATGRGAVALAVPLSTGPYFAGPGTPFPATVTADELDHLTGRITSVADAGFADLLLIPAMAPDGPALFAVEAVTSGLTRNAVVCLDLTRPLHDVTLVDVPARRLALGDQAAAALARALTVGAAMLASEQLGVAQACLDLTVDYLKTRTQFGRLIGSYQALKHRAADLWASVTQARAVARYAAACVADDDPDTPVAVALAQAYCSGVAVRAAEECVQLHGGIGFTWEHPAHLYLKRAKSASLALGTAARHRAALGRLVDLPAAAQPE
ncbi:MAG TPA: acyl-CoA dehydrogenase family protein [Actinocrinis sp.]|uniref:acyl-CoA dehydrogenase family protein n=1 Tax=Actinocrinis sp. TaxID=1920516 RepID=UPI002DDCE36F|nr:acyl-CoA dehydrogenase family protein [Actinocrinis sp.]HEV2346011.1 acyl-CoA dehydrogenase family protein [Actinocrinis sp.]